MPPAVAAPLAAKLAARASSTKPAEARPALRLAAAVVRCAGSAVKAKYGALEAAAAAVIGSGAGMEGEAAACDLLAALAAAPGAGGVDGHAAYALLLRRALLASTAALRRCAPEGAKPPLEDDPPPALDASADADAEAQAQAGLPASERAASAAARCGRWLRCSAALLEAAPLGPARLPAAEAVGAAAAALRARVAQEPAALLLRALGAAAAAVLPGQVALPAARAVLRDGLGTAEPPHVRALLHETATELLWAGGVGLAAVKCDEDERCAAAALRHALEDMTAIRREGRRRAAATALAAAAAQGGVVASGGRKRKRKGQAARQAAQQAAVEAAAAAGAAAASEQDAEEAMPWPAALPPQQLELLAAALGTAEAVIAQGAFFIGEEQRSYADRDALEAAAYLLDASDMRPAACGAATEASVAFLLATLLSPRPFRPPFLAQGLSLLREGARRCGGSARRAFQRSQLALEPLLHPRARPLPALPAEDDRWAWGPRWANETQEGSGDEEDEEGVGGSGAGAAMVPPSSAAAQTKPPRPLKLLPQRQPSLASWLPASPRNAAMGATNSDTPTSAVAAARPSPLGTAAAAPEVAGGAAGGDEGDQSDSSDSDGDFPELVDE